MNSIIDVVILAAGQGKRMNSALPKVLHVVGAKSLLGHVIDTAHMLDARSIHVVYGHGGDQVRAAFADTDLTWAEQARQLGTGHAVQQAMPAIADDALVMILYGDVPLTARETLDHLRSRASADRVALLTADLPDPRGYGRIIRDKAGRVVKIVEQKDATADEAAVREVNTGILIAPAKRLRDWLGRLQNKNAQGEYYLTDVIAMAVADGIEIATHQPRATWEMLGVNSKVELAQLERIHQQNQAQALLAQGVTLRDPARFDLRGQLTCGRDVVIDVNVIIEGNVTLGDNVKIGPNNYLRDVTIAAGTEILPNCVIEEAEIGEGSKIGPFARIRPGTKLTGHAHIGNFVEIKKSVIGEGSKVNHLSYIGDSVIGKKVNVGAGTITCNYDGANKFTTTIEDNVFVGSNTALVAPVTIREGATIGAGSVITKDAPKSELTVARAKQLTITGWQRPQKKPK